MLKPELGLYESIFKRSSRRNFASIPLSNSHFEELSQLSERIMLHEPNLRIIISKEGADHVFKSRIGYGMIHSSHSYIALIVKGNELDDLVRLGYYGEWLVLTATKLGLATCWVGGTYNRNATETLLQIKPGETLAAVIPVGDAASEKSMVEAAMGLFGGIKKRKPIEEIYLGLDSAMLSEWKKTALECVKVGPSAINMQPWRFIPYENRLRIMAAAGKVNTKMSPIDCGIAMLHFSIGARQAGMKGSWMAAPDPYLAEYVPED